MWNPLLYDYVHTACITDVFLLSEKATIYCLHAICMQSSVNPALLWMRSPDKESSVNLLSAKHDYVRSKAVLLAG